MVYVLNSDGSPLMPCTEAKARHLIESGKAKVVRRTPFTIRLAFLVEGEVNTESVTLGVDAGSSVIGVSVTTEDRVLLEAEVEIRQDVPQNMEERRSKRSGRRSRKTRYREQRSDNRRCPEGWLTPTMETKVRTHENVIDKVCSILPVSRIVIESASFDIQKIRDPGIGGEEYQQGEQLGYENVKAYVRARDGFRCRSCGSRDHLEVHHIRQRKDGGSDSPDNLIILCHGCHMAWHEGKKDHHIRQRKDGGSNSPDNLITLCHGCHRAWHEGKKDMVTLSSDPGFKAATQMSTMRWILLDRVRKAHPDIPVEGTYGYVTNHERNSHGLEKRHFIDARVISGNATARSDGVLWHIVAGRSHNRKIHKDTILENGVRKANQATRKVAGYGLGDKVRYAGQLCCIHGRRSSGYFDIRRPDGKAGWYKGPCWSTLQASYARRACEYESYLQGGCGGSSLRTSLMVSPP